MESLRNILPATIKKLGIKRKFNSELAVVHWRDIVGVKIASHARPVSIENHLMFVAVNNSAWSHHLSTMKETIIAKINSFIGEKVIQDIRFQAGYFKNCQNEESTAETRMVPLSNIKLDENDVSIINNIANITADSELRSKIQVILTKDLAMKKLRRENRWHKCGQCDALCPPDKQYCPACLIKRKQMTRDEIYRTLLEAPWLTYQDVCQFVDCSQTDYKEVKYAVKAVLLAELSSGKKHKIDTLALVMLLTGVKPDQITDELIKTTIAKLGGKNHVFASGG
jgi:hypothetical protein